MSKARRPIANGPSSVLRLKDVELHVFDDVHPYCNSDCYADCYGVAAVLPEAKLYSKVYSGGLNALQLALVDLARQCGKTALPVVPEPVVIEQPMTPLEFQDLES